MSKANQALNWIANMWCLAGNFIGMKTVVAAI